MLISAGDLIRKSFALYKQNFGLFIKYVLLTYIPAAIIAIAGVFLGGAASFLFFSDNKGSAGVALAVLIIILLVSIVASIWIFLAFIRVIAARYLEKAPEAVGIELKKVAPLILPYIGATLLFGIIMLGGFILFIIPAIIFAVWFAFYFYEIALDNKGGLDSLKGSKALVSGRWWSILWRLFAPAAVFGILAFAVQAIVQFPFELAAQNTASTITFVVTTVLSVIFGAAVNAFITPLTASAQTILYIEAKNTSAGSQSTPPPSMPNPAEPAAPKQ